MRNRTLLAAALVATTFAWVGCSTPPQGAGTACGTGQACQAGVCNCTQQACPNGCCSGGNCLPGNTGTACGSGGQSCANCGGTGVCDAGICAGQCTPTNCGNGCCSGSSCLVRGVNACAPAGQACQVCDPIRANQCSGAGVC